MLKKNIVKKIFKKIIKKIIIKIFFLDINFLLLLLLKRIIMVNLTTHELRLIAEKRNIKDHKKMSREELLRTFDE